MCLLRLVCCFDFDVAFCFCFWYLRLDECVLVGFYSLRGFVWVSYECCVCLFQELVCGLCFLFREFVGVDLLCWFCFVQLISFCSGLGFDFRLVLYSVVLIFVLTFVVVYFVFCLLVTEFGLYCYFGLTCLWDLIFVYFDWIALCVLYLDIIQFVMCLLFVFLCIRYLDLRVLIVLTQFVWFAWIGIDCLLFVAVLVNFGLMFLLFCFVCISIFLVVICYLFVVQLSVFVLILLLYFEVLCFVLSGFAQLGRLCCYQCFV